MHAYKVTARLNNGVDLDDPDLRENLNQNRDKAFGELRQFGGDPLPDQEIPFIMDRSNRTVVFVFRSNIIGPDDERLMGVVSRQVSTLKFTNRIQVEHHVCGNGTRRKCQPWKVIFKQDL